MLDTLKTCACGLVMVPLNAQSTIALCPNCDTGHQKGAPHTTQTRRFNLHWARKMRTIYG